LSYQSPIDTEAAKRETQKILLKPQVVEERKIIKEEGKRSEYGEHSVTYMSKDMSYIGRKKGYI